LVRSDCKINLRLHLVSNQGSKSQCAFYRNQEQKVTKALKLRQNVNRTRTEFLKSLTAVYRKVYCHIRFYYINTVATLGREIETGIQSNEI
jgi:hypothetical protein